jgi:hypothetical protein
MFRKKSITLINETWEKIDVGLNLLEIPRKNELIYVEKTQIYYKVINVIHYLNNKHGIFVVVEKYGNQKIF